MEPLILIIVIVGVSISVISAALVVVSMYRKKWKLAREIDSVSQTTDVSQQIKIQSGKWGLLITLYLLLCMIFIAIILYQAAQGMEGRALDCLAVLVGAVFFMFQALLKRSTEKRRERATAHTTATLVAIESTMGDEAGSVDYYSIYEFYAEGATHKVKSHGANGLDKGDRVDLYYAPHYPKMIYIPRVEKSRNRWAVLLYIVGIAAPLFGLTAPLW